jgi:hypothetical protein
MDVDSANIDELAQIAGEIGPDVMKGALRYLSDSGRCLLDGTMRKSTTCCEAVGVSQAGVTEWQHTKKA